MDRFDEIVEELNKHLECRNQNWFFGAGISYGANIPLMTCLTKRVASMIPPGEKKTIYDAISSDLPDGYHIEHVLSHLGDHIAIAERAKSNSTTINGNVYQCQKLHDLHAVAIRYIGETIRYGYCEADATAGTPEKIGEIADSIINIDSHLEFVNTLLTTRANLLPRSSISLFTTNYDTLLEDALSLYKIAVNDGFTGSAIGYWNPRKSFRNSEGINVVKLHGSVDWVNDSKFGLVRNRYGVNYLDKDSNVLIYPQATKSVETQKDPFASLFVEFRTKLSSPNENILVVGGFSFGDEHINSEIIQALNMADNKTTLIAFIVDMNDTLQNLLRTEQTKKKVFVCTEKGLYHGEDTLIPKTGTANLSWWQFDPMIQFLKDGEPV